MPPNPAERRVVKLAVTALAITAALCFVGYWMSFYLAHAGFGIAKVVYWPILGVSILADGSGDFWVFAMAIAAEFVYVLLIVIVIAAMKEWLFGP